MKKTIILNAGHSINDSGAVSNGEMESYHARIVRDKLLPLLQKTFEVKCVPDELDLVDSINWVNKQVSNLEDGYAFSIHLNSNSGEAGSGAEVWYCGGSPTSEPVKLVKSMAQSILDKYCEMTDYRKRGIFSDLTSRHGRLGWVRDTNCYAGLIELCFINNSKEINFLKNNYQLIAEALYQGILNAYGIEGEEIMEVDQSKLTEIYKEILFRKPDEGANGYIGQAETFVRQELMNSPERKEKEENLSKFEQIKTIIN